MGNRKPDPLSESELDKIIGKIPSIRDRAKMTSHLSVVRGWSEPPDAEHDTAAIVEWIRNTWAEDTVRAKMARKIAGLIEKGEHLAEGGE